ncbi:MSC_0775 family lipoprotein [Mycoplasma elephantis]|uniref:MSC_0775 family lipoprotein n=1 Tax=Mycoplasma elephantis TaxID=114882 RepID=UPI00048161A2|nr:hypothetical protein [Mycoplasma elephantis]
MKSIYIYNILATLSLIPLSNVLISCNNKEVSNKEIFINYSSLNKEDKQFNSKLNEIIKINEINILSDIKNYFESNNYELNNFIVFTSNASNKTVEFNLMKKNNYMIKYMKFDKDKFLNLLKDKFNFTNEFLKRIEFKIDYNNVTRDQGNYFDVIFPIILKIKNIDAFSSNLYSSCTINFRLENVLLNKNEEKIMSTLRDSLEDIKKLKESDFNVNFTLNNEIIELINKYGINELDLDTFNNMFKVKSDKWNKLTNKHKNLKFKLTPYKIDFYSVNDLNKAKVKVRLAVSSYDNKLKSNADVGKDIWITFNLNNSSFEKELKIINSIIINSKYEPINNADLSIIKPSDLIIKTNNKNILDIKISKILTNKNDFRNASIELIVTLSNNTKLKINKKVGVGHYSFLYSKEFTKDNIKAYNFNASRLTSADLHSIDTSFFNMHNSKLFTGGYGTSRGFYADDIKTPVYLHFGEDYIAPDFTKILMPYDGEIIAGFELKTKKAASGVGTCILVKIPISNLDWTPREKQLYLDKDSEYILMSFIHLDANLTLKNENYNWVITKELLGSERIINVCNATPDNPTKANKGDVIGYLGSVSTNGGWMSHVHVNLYSNRSEFLTPNFFYTKVKKIGSSSKIRRKIDDKRLDQYSKFHSPVGNVGVKSLSSNFDLSVYKVNPLNGLEILFDKDTNKELDKDAKGEYIKDKLDPITNKKKKIEIKRIKLENEYLLYVNNIDMISCEREDGYLDPNIVYKLRDENTLSFDLHDIYEINE